jgi:hypothetical protein
MGAEAVRKLLMRLDLVKLSENCAQGELARNQLQAEEEGPDQAAEDRRVDPRQRQQAGVDGAGRDPGHPAGPAPAGAAGFAATSPPAT